MAQAGEVFADNHITVQDIRFDYGEARFIPVGHLQDRMVVLAWTERASSERPFVHLVAFCQFKRRSADNLANALRRRSAPMIWMALA